jgi:hypothetical protein
MIDYLKEQLDGKALPTTGNSEATVPFGRDALEKAYRDKVRTLTTIVRALLVDAGQRARPDDTLVPAPPPVPDRWAWAATSVKAGIVGATLALHLLQTAVIVWLVLDAVRR